MRDIRFTAAYRALKAWVRSEEDTCWLCGKHIDRTIPYRNPITGRVNPQSWSLDHVIPITVAPMLALIRSNVRAAHLSCNSGRGNRAAKPAPPALHTTRAW